MAASKNLLRALRVVIATHFEIKSINALTACDSGSAGDVVISEWKILNIAICLSEIC